MPQQSSTFRVSYQLLDLDSEESPGHCLGVNDVLVSDDGSLVTAGRDSFIHAWKVSGNSSSIRCTLSHHSHWVNQLCMCSSTLRRYFLILFDSIF